MRFLDPGRQSMLALLMPSKVEIVKPFTRVARIEDPHATGLDVELQLLLRAFNTLGNPGLMIVGDVRVELYEYRPAGPDSKGVQLSRWTILLDNPEDQRKYWNPVTQMYEFRLGIRREDIPSAEKYVVVVTYNSPLGEHLFDEYVMAVSKLDRSGN
ncbi:MAG: hypothetical protein IIC83_08285 [Chloroflexi bacterium]|nr:hypothetical protein [Chloroflexota bacterium]